jgi:Scramblase
VTEQLAVVRRVPGARGCCILGGVGDLFDVPALRIRQPGKLLADRAIYEIFNADRRLLATAVETEGHAQLKLLSKSMPDTRVFAVTTASGEPVLSLIKQTSEWMTELRSPTGELTGRIRTGGTRRVYTLLDERDQAVARVTGDLALRRFVVTGTAGGKFALVRKTWAGLTKEILTPSDHYTVEFTGPASAPTRTLTVMMPIVLDLTVFGPI